MSRLPRPAAHVQRVTQPGGEPGARPGTKPGQQGQPGAGSVESLYPFLYEGKMDPGQVVAQARQSTVAKTREIIDLRAEVCSRNSELLGSCAKDMAARFATGGRMLTFGNGGSATDAQEIAALFMYPQDAATSLPAIGLASDVSVLTSLANDIGVEVVFSRQIAAFGRPGDMALGLSTSGNSENLLRAFDEAHRIGLMTVGLSGYDGGKMAEIASMDYLFVAPSASIHRIQEAQTTIYHILWELVVAELATRPAIT
jgi:D-sedoheptulose 7-phosphate isomerase